MANRVYVANFTHVPVLNEDGSHDMYHRGDELKLDPSSKAAKWLLGMDPPAIRLKSEEPEEAPPVVLQGVSGSPQDTEAPITVDPVV